MKKGMEVPEELQEVKKFTQSMKYTLNDLRRLRPFELCFIKKRCMEEKIKGFDEYMKLIGR